ncbi:MAG: asparagine synthase C-terminal domain-containing protein, partial [Planctomycetota bacterium]
MHLKSAITSRLEADVPLGVFLSGGIDSALIAALTKQHRPDIKTFTVRMPEAAYDESADAAETAAHIGTDHHTLDCQPEPASDLVMLIEQLGLPFGDSSLLPTYWVSKAAREHVKVALSGDGGDELFGGYRRHTINPMLNKYRHLLRQIPSRLLDRRTPGSHSEYLARLANAAKFGGYTELLAIFQTPDLRKLIPSIDGEPVGDDDFHAIDDPLRYDFEHYLPDDLLRKTDTASMAVGLEVRAPFLARELVEAALRTPLNVLMPKGERKGLLKQVARTYLPEHIVSRPKRGFAIPIGDWFRSDYGGMRTLLYDHLESTEPFPGLAEAGVELNMEFVRQMLREHDAAGEKSLNPWHGRDHSQRLYMLLVLSIWSKWLAGLQKDTRP